MDRVCKMEEDVELIFASSGKSSTQRFEGGTSSDVMTTTIPGHEIILLTVDISQEKCTPKRKKRHHHHNHHN